MASISKRGNRWFAQVRRKGHPHKHKVFKTRREAVAWAIAREAELDAFPVPGAPRLSLANVTLGDLIRRYLVEVTPTKRSADTERFRVRKLALSTVCSVPLASLTPEMVARYRDARLKQVKPSTVRRELAILGHALEVAKREWGYAITQNPIGLIRLPSVRDARDRRPTKEELERLWVELERQGNPLVPVAVRLALETGLRRSELLGLEWRYINLVDHTARVPLSKNGRPRTIPLTERAVAIMGALERQGDGRVVPLSPNALRLAWERAKRRAGIHDLRFHDLRHEAISRFAELGLNVPELALISGHRDVRMLLRYTHVQPVFLARKLHALSASEPSSPSRSMEAERP